MTGMGKETRTKFGIALLLALLVGVLSSLPLAAQVDQDTLNKLLQRIDQLEKQVNDLKQQAVDAKAAQAKQPAAPPANQFYASAKSRIEFYGYAKLDMAYDTGRVYPGNYALYVSPMPLNDNDNSQYNMTANQTRLGMNFTAVDTGDVKVTGKLEFDLYGNGTANNKAAPLWRHYYMQVYWPKHDFAILAGQTSDIISPLVAPTINYTVQWQQGNIGYRHPQLRLDKGWKLGDNSRFDWQVGFVWGAGHSYTNLSGTYNSAVTAYAPTVQTRVGFTFPGADNRKVNLGLSYHYGRETFLPGLPNEKSIRLSTFSYNFDASVPLGKNWTFQGEYYYGADLDQFFGGSNQAVNLKMEKGTVASGGWAAVTYQATPKLVFNLGGGADSPQLGDLDTGARGNNSNVFLNGWYTIAKQTQVGLEVSRLVTGYVDKDTVKAMRYQLSFMYTF